MPSFRSVLIAFALAILSPAPGLGQDRYFVMIFGSQPQNKSPQRCHTWGSLIKFYESNGVLKPEVHTISWVPADLKVRLLAIRSKPGINMNLQSTIERYQNLNGKVSVWGPYEIQDGTGPGLYERTLQQIARLEKGEVKYMAIDPDFGPRVQTVSDCIHAITDIDENHGRSFYSELFRFGDSASEFIVAALARRGRINRSVRHEWVLEAIGLDCASLTRR